MGCGTALKEAHPAAARETLPIVAAKPEFRAMRNGPCTHHYRTAQNEKVVANYGGGIVPWKNRQREKKGGHELSTTYLIGRVHEPV